MKQRIITALILVPLALAVVACTSPYPFFLLALALTTLGVYEIAGMSGHQKVLPVVSLLGVALPFYAYNVAKTISLASELAVSSLLFLLAVFTLAMAARKRNWNSASVDLGGLWIAMPMLGLTVLHDYAHPASGLWNLRTPVLYALVPIWIGDTAAILVGKYAGKHLIAPKLSPKKTIEGSIANFVSCVGIAFVIGYFFHQNWLVSLACGVLCGTVGQMGDLFESYIKRQCGVKDSGRIFPGHGGVLDRLDSVLFAAIPVAFVICYLTPSLIKLDGRNHNLPATKGLHVDPKSARIVGGD